MISKRWNLLDDGIKLPLNSNTTINRKLVRCEGCLIQRFQVDNITLCHLIRFYYKYIYIIVKCITQHTALQNNSKWAFCTRAHLKELKSSSTILVRTQKAGLFDVWCAVHRVHWHIFHDKNNFTLSTENASCCLFSAHIR